MSDPFRIFELHRDLPNATTQSRIWQACKRFKQQFEHDIQHNHNLFKPAKGPPGITYQVPDKDLMLLEFQKHCCWFLGELSEAWTIWHVPGIPEPQGSKRSRKS